MARHPGRDVGLAGPARRRDRPSRGDRAARAHPLLAHLQALLLALVLVHGLLGARVILLDFGLPVRWHRLLLILAVALAVVIFAAVWGWRWS